MNLKLNKLIIINFKGIKNLTVDFSDITNVFGDNATCKTTLFDAFIWLFFGKDSTDRKDTNFSIKTVDQNGNPIPKQEVDVFGFFTTDDGPLTLRRVLKEKWVKKQGSKIPEFTGNETLYFWNEVPSSQAEYSAKLNKLIDENLFKLITNSLYFNSLNWKKRREVLFEMAGNISDPDIIDSLMTVQNKGEFGNLINVLNSGKTIDEYKREISSKKKKIKDELELIPTRIDEIQRGIPEEKDFATIEVSINQYNEGIKDIETSMHNASEAHNKKFEGIQEKQNEVHKLKTRQNDIEFQLKGEIQKKANDRSLKVNQLNSTIERISVDIKSKTALLESQKTKKEGLTLRVNNLRDLWVSTSEKQFEFNEESDLNFEGSLSVLCDGCKDKLKSMDVESKREHLFKTFQDEKTRSIDAITAQGQGLNKEVEECDEMISTLEKALGKLNEDLFVAKEELNVFGHSNAEPTKTVEELLSVHDEYLKLKSQIDSLQASIENPAPLDLSDLKNKKSEMSQRIDELKTELSVRDQITRAKERIKQLAEQEQDLSQQLCDLEGIEFTIDDFNRAKIESIEARINGKFQHVKFKLFDTQINGGEVECCETLVNGVPFADANNAAKINAGLDIINALCTHYKTYAPCFIDNAESITKLIPVQSQIIRLVVTEGSMLSIGAPKYTPEYIIKMKNQGIDLIIDAA